MHFAPNFAAAGPIPFGAMVRDHGRPPAREPQQGRRAFLARTHRRRFACLRAAAEALDHLPAEGESLHALMTGLYDLQHLIIALLDRFDSPCRTMRVATLSLSARNVAEMVALLDSGKVGRLDLLTSDFFRKHETEIMAELLTEFAARGQRVAAARCHAKVVTMALEDGRCYVLEGSANLRTNHNLEQFALARDPDLFAFYDAWLDGMVKTHEIGRKDHPQTG
jgi:hypothetical protein